MNVSIFDLGSVGCVGLGCLAQHGPGKFVHGLAGLRPTAKELQYHGNAW